jgi:hypothetical protein
MKAKRVKIGLDILIPIYNDMSENFEKEYIEGYLAKTAEILEEDFGRVIEDHGYELEQSSTEIG